MRFMLDENLPVELARLFRAAWHDAATALDQELQGARVSEFVSVCRREGCAIVTLDMGLSDIRTYPPDAYPGFVVLRPGAQSRDQVLRFGSRLLNVLSGAALAGQLWIVEDSRIRVRR